MREAVLAGPPNPSMLKTVIPQKLVLGAQRIANLESQTP
ncbi:hypothetical protein SynA1544_01209 [Synechococcus sp. A15-44]|nr:hypothetical protein SynA1544_01209 [Synechococcus sp. A15-44]